MKVASRRRRRRKSFLQAVVITAVLTVIFAVNAAIRPTVKAAATSQAQIQITHIVQQSVLQVLQQDEIRYGSIVTLTQNNSGDTTALLTDAVAINRLQSTLLEEIIKELRAEENLRITLPLGTLLGGQYLAGRGPDIRFELIPAGMVHTHIVHEFDAAGINQTRHRIRLDVTVEMLSILPGYRIPSKAETSVTLAETVIVGLVPDAYTEVYTGTEDLVGTLQDYGAVAME